MIKKIRSTGFGLTAVVGLCVVIPGGIRAGSISTANTTLFGPNVYVFDTNMPVVDIQSTATSIFSKMEANQFGSERYALLFRPGAYSVNFNVGFLHSCRRAGAEPR